MLKRALYISMIILISFFSCKKDDDKPVVTKIDYSYYPLTVGNYVMYNVTEINIDKPLNIYDTTIYQLKEFVESQFIGSNGKTQYRLERYKRANDTMSWVISDVWAVYFLDNKLVKVEENIPLIKINFPVKQNKAWDGNKLNTLDSVLFTITNLNIADTVSSTLFDSVLTVTVTNEESLIDKKLIYEKFAKNIGLIEKIDININSQPENGEPVDITVPIENRITTGTIYRQQIFDYNINRHYSH